MSDEKKPFHNPFGALAGLKDALPQGPAPKPAAAAAKTSGPARAVVRLERAGRRGKEVTVIEHLELPAKEREAWLTALKGAMGCGGGLEGEALVLQGDHRQRAAQWLERKGVKKVTVGT
jgi:translation initiation factor 1